MSACTVCGAADAGTAGGPLDATPRSSRHIMPTHARRTLRNVDQLASLVGKPTEKPTENVRFRFRFFSV